MLIFLLFLVFFVGGGVCWLFFSVFGEGHCLHAHFLLFVSLLVSKETVPKREGWGEGGGAGGWEREGMVDTNGKCKPSA